MSRKNIDFGFYMQFIGFILLLFVGIIFWVVHIIDNLISLNFLLIYTAYLVYSFLILISYAKEGQIFNLDNKESLELTKLRMSHSFTFSLFTIGVSIPFLSITYLKDNWLIFFGALIILCFGIFYLFKGYYLRFKKIERGILNENGTKN